MREPLKMFTASLMQNMVQIRKKNAYFVIELFYEIFGKSPFWLSALRAPMVGPLRWYRCGRRASKNGVPQRFVQPDLRTMDYRIYNQVMQLVSLCGLQHEI